MTVRAERRYVRPMGMTCAMLPIREPRVRPSMMRYTMTVPSNLAVCPIAMNMAGKMKRKSKGMNQNGPWVGLDWLTTTIWVDVTVALPPLPPVTVDTVQFSIVEAPKNIGVAAGV